jgi:hypothetical protein
MRIRFAITVVCFAMAFPALPAIADEATTVAQLKEAVLEVNRAYAHRGAATVERMTTQDHIAVASQFRKPLTISEQVDTLGDYKREPFDFTDIDVTLLADNAAFVTYENSYKGDGFYRGDPLPPRVYVSQIWLKQDGAWRQSFYQETPIVSP